MTFFAFHFILVDFLHRWHIILLFTINRIIIGIFHITIFRLVVLVSRMHIGNVRTHADKIIHIQLLNRNHFYNFLFARNIFEMFNATSH